MSSADYLLVIHKPESAKVECSAPQVRVILEGWEGVVRWLHGEDRHSLPEVTNAVIDRVAAKLAKGTPRRLEEYSMVTWRRQSEGIELPRLDGGAELAGVTTALFESIGFTRTQEKQGTLNAEGVTMLYGENDDFARNTQIAIDHMVGGPVIAGYWEGKNTQLAQGVKLTVRAALNAIRQANGEPQLEKRRNYLHVGYMSPDDTARFFSTITPLAPPPGPNRGGNRPRFGTPWQDSFAPGISPHGARSRALAF